MFLPLLVKIATANLVSARKDILNVIVPKNAKDSVVMKVVITRETIPIKKLNKYQADYSLGFLLH
ncbi:MAG: hypothetical protein NZO16_01040 [Deltaproteobacteria bacterium]|nr:hypothetical protein [Deltaproteobacteria bacterium]